LNHNAASLRVSFADETLAARAGLGASPPDFSLIVDRSEPRRKGPARFALRVDRTVPKGAAPPGYALFADVRAFGQAKVWRRRALFAAIVLALALLVHLSLLAPILVQPAPSLRELGMENGLPENLNVSVISEADLKRLSSDPYRQEAPPAPTPRNADETMPAPEDAKADQDTPEPPQPEAKQASAPPPAEPLFDEKPAPYDPSGFIAKAAQQFTMQIERSMEAPPAPREQARRAARSAGNVRVLRPGATHSGQSDEFERNVVWALAGTKPMGNGKWGTAVVTFVVTEAGRLEGLRLIKSSGDNWLDTGVLMSVKQARLPVPPRGLTAGDRTFNVEYISIPN
jgi:periplasmic protein TonB